MPGKGRRTEGRDPARQAEPASRGGARRDADRFPAGPGETKKGDPPLEWQRGATRPERGRGREE